MNYKLFSKRLFYLLVILVQGCSHSISYLNLNDVQQETSYSCGASAARSILLYYGIVRSEKQIVEEFGTNESSGTSPEQLIMGFNKYGLEAIAKKNATLNDINKNLDEKYPTLVAVQAWLENYPPKNWENNWEDGHWLIVIGMDNQNIYFEDPSLLGSKGYMTKDEFLSRWHDYVGEIPCCDSLDTIYNHLMITVKGNPAEQIMHID